MKHLSDNQLSARLDGALSGDDLARVKSHLAACLECRSRLETLANEERALRRALEHDPGEAYFATFADRVQGRLRAEGLAGAQARERGNVAGWFGRPRNLAIAGAVATVIVGAGIVLINSHEVEMPTLRRAKLESRAVAPAPPSSLEVQQSEPPAVGLPTPTLGAPTAPGEPAASDSREPAADQAPGSEPGVASEGATAQRAYEVRRDANGEDVPVNPPRAIVSPSPTPTNALQPETGGRRVIKQRRAEPMGAASTTPGPSLAPAPSGVPLGTDTAPLMQKTAPAPTASAPTPSATAPSAGAPTADALARNKGTETATSTSKPAKAAAPLPAPHSITTPTTASRAQEREERVPARADEGQAKRSLVIDEQKDLGSGELCGQVLDNLGRAMGTAEVLIAETGTSTRTDSRGHFCIRAPAGYRTVVVMAPGYDEVRRPVTVAERNPDLAFVMSAIPAQGPTYGFVARPRDSAAPAPTASSPTAPLDKPLDKPAGNTLGATRSLYGTGPSRTALDQLVSEAQRISTDAANDGSASHFEAAAEAWERVLPLVRGKPAEHDIRFHMAEQRYLAWEANPTHARSLRAHSALSSYVLRAPAGAQRDQATRWLGVVK